MQSSLRNSLYIANPDFYRKNISWCFKMMSTFKSSWTLLRVDARMHVSHYNLNDILNFQ